MSLGTVLLDEEILPIVDITLAEGAIRVTFYATAALLSILPETVDYSVHAPDGTFCWRGRVRIGPADPDLSPIQPIEMNLALSVVDKTTESVWKGPA